MTKLTTHVLDTAKGTPAKQMTLRLAKLDGDTRTSIIETKTNGDGRCDAPLLEGDSMQAGTYELEFEVGEYFGVKSSHAFLNCVVLRFGIDDPGSHYHVPLLCSPYSYSTYRGS